MNKINNLLNKCLFESQYFCYIISAGHLRLVRQNQTINLSAEIFSFYFSFKETFILHLSVLEEERWKAMCL